MRDWFAIQATSIVAPRMVRGRLGGRIVEIRPGGMRELPSESLGHLAGGSVEVDMSAPQRAVAKEPFFEVRIEPEGEVQLHAGQRVVVRFTLPEKPLLSQWWRSLRQLGQRRFRI